MSNENFDGRQEFNESRSEILKKYEKLRQDVRCLHAKVVEKELRLEELREMIKILKVTDRKCFLMRSDILMEGNALTYALNEKEKSEKRLEDLKVEIGEKVKQLRDFQSNFSIRVPS
ncbi:prefoldin subunit 2-like [Parasteatoda tepidariorum]|uniref:prefoldin subunit 2-like n=1 Tax=Parasteatoda tepidariorum TaxID=114398 RepID=UPI00077F990F|nr:uncharacterized protein LOC107446403 [Parasteatoda tepidariorum]